MAKLYGLFGSMTGKLADVVMSVRNGEQIARKYQPVVFNPSTPAQVASRAKLKMLSQLSAVFAPVIAIPREGNVSSRNLFTKLNYAATTYASQNADVNMSDVKITKSVVALPNIVATRGANELAVSLGFEDPTLSRVVYAAFVKQNEKLYFVGSTVVTTPGTNGLWEGALGQRAAEMFVYAYGVRDNTQAARAVFGNLISPSAQDIARVIVSSTLSESDITVTETGFQVVPPAN